MHVGTVCARSLATCHRSASALEIARQMRDGHVGEVIVVEERAGRTCPIGVVTERDLIVHVLCAACDAARTNASDLIGAQLETVLQTEFVYDAIAKMRKLRVGRLAVVDERGGLIGVLRAEDVSEFLAGELIELARITSQHLAMQEAALKTPVLA